jgi:hypothetical protein
MSFREFFFYFCTTEWNSELCSLPLNGSEWNSESLLLFLFQGMDFRVVFYSAEEFGIYILYVHFTTFRLAFKYGVLRTARYFKHSWALSSSKLAESSSSR